MLAFLLILLIPSPPADAAPKNTSSSSMPYAYGFIAGDGSIVYGSGNFTVEKIEGLYRVTLTADSYLPGKHLVFITPGTPCQPYAQSSINQMGTLEIGFRDVAATLCSTEFQFVIYKTDYLPVLRLYYMDQDADGFGLADDFKQLAYPQTPYTARVGGDCDDTNGQVYPGALEICNNSIDDDCDGFVDEDCPDLTTYYRDQDQDDFGLSEDSRLLAQPEGTYTALVGGDCDDSSQQVHPGAVEKCDALDNDCDGRVDADIPGDGIPCDGGDLDSCPEGVIMCTGSGGWVCTDTTNDTLEICGDMLDNDCDGYVDEDCEPPTCDDGDPCTIDEYNPSLGTCTHTPMSCDDNDPNTTDFCDPGIGCVHILP